MKSLNERETQPETASPRTPEEEALERIYLGEAGSNESISDYQTLKAALAEKDIEINMLKAELEEKDKALNDALFYNRDVLEAELTALEKQASIYLKQAKKLEKLLDGERLRGILDTLHGDLNFCYDSKQANRIYDKTIAAICKESEKG